jgi:hypothetical protein
MQNSHIPKEIGNEPPEQIINNFLELLNSTQKSNVEKTECMKRFLNFLKKNFSQCNKENILLNEKHEKSFEQELINKCQSVSLSLLICFIELNNNNSLYRLLAIRIILYLTHLECFHEQFQKYNISIYIVRIIDLDLSIDETSLCIEYIRLICQLYPASLNEAFIYCLLSSLEDSKYRLNNLILETLLEIIVKQPELACKCQVFTDLINYLINACTDSEFCIQIIIQTLLKTLDRPECRHLLRFDDLFSTIIAPIIDFE